MIRSATDRRPDGPERACPRSHRAASDIPAIRYQPPPSEITPPSTFVATVDDDPGVDAGVRGDVGIGPTVELAAVVTDPVLVARAKTADRPGCCATTASRPEPAGAGVRWAASGRQGSSGAGSSTTPAFPNSAATTACRPPPRTATSTKD